jgi:hypothetical protein
MLNPNTKFRRNPTGSFGDETREQKGRHYLPIIR